MIFNNLKLIWRKSVEITADSVSELQTSIASQMGITIEEQK